MADGHTTSPSFFDVAREIVAGQQAAFDCAPPTGVCWGGMSPDRPRVESIADVAERLRIEHERLAAFRASPRGRFYRVVGELADIGAPEAQQLRGYYDRSISLLNGATLEADALPAVAECIAILNGLVGRDARAGIDALTDLLREEGPQIGKAA